MTTASTLPPVQECSVGSCGYNAESACHAGAITVGGDQAGPSAGTTSRSSAPPAPCASARALTRRTA
jgi:hypothetical protein